LTNSGSTGSTVATADSTEASGGVGWGISPRSWELLRLDAFDWIADRLASGAIDSDLSIGEPAREAESEAGG
jgi:hypothetical protein